MRTTKKADVIHEEDEYLDFILGGPGGFTKKQSTLKDQGRQMSIKNIKKSGTMKKIPVSKTSVSPELKQLNNSSSELVPPKPKIKKEKTIDDPFSFKPKKASAFGKVKMASWALVALKNTNLTKNATDDDSEQQ